MALERMEALKTGLRNVTKLPARKDDLFSAARLARESKGMALATLPPGCKENGPARHESFFWLVTRRGLEFDKLVFLL